MFEEQTTGVLLEYLHARELDIEAGYLPAALGALAQALMGVEVRRKIAAGRYERNMTRRAYRNGYRSTTWRTEHGDVTLCIPKLRHGTYYPNFLTLAVENKLYRFALDAYVQGVQQVELDHLMTDIGFGDLDSEEFSEVSHALENVIADYRERPLPNAYDCVYLDLVRFLSDGWQRCLLVAIGVDQDGEAELLAHEVVGEADHEEWAWLLKGLRSRGLEQINELVSYDFPGLRTAAHHVFPDATWQPESAFLLGYGHVVDAVSRLRIDAPADEYPYLPRMELDLTIRWPLWAVA
ncbi:MAG: transposase [Anaerolineae bacterium]|nr:transposase [Anaerolineae bacterium]